MSSGIRSFHSWKLCFWTSMKSDFTAHFQIDFESQANPLTCSSNHSLRIFALWQEVTSHQKRLLPLQWKGGTWFATMFREALKKHLCFYARTQGFPAQCRPEHHTASAILPFSHSGICYHLHSQFPHTSVTVAGSLVVLSFLTRFRVNEPLHTTNTTRPAVLGRSVPVIYHNMANFTCFQHINFKNWIFYWCLI